MNLPETDVTLPQKEQGCPQCHSKGEASEIDGMGTMICHNCGALVLFTPFGYKLLASDARVRHPQYNNLPVKAWVANEKKSDVLGEKMK